MQVELEKAELAEQYETLLAQYRWVHAILAVILEEQGGVVKLDRETLENYDLNGAFSVWQEDDAYFVAVKESAE